MTNIRAYSRALRSFVFAIALVRGSPDGTRRRDFSRRCVRCVRGFSTLGIHRVFHYKRNIYTRAYTRPPPERNFDGHYAPGTLLRTNNIQARVERETERRV